MDDAEHAQALVLECDQGNVEWHPVNKSLRSVDRVPQSSATATLFVSSSSSPRIPWRGYSWPFAARM